MSSNDLLNKLPGYRKQLEELDQSLSTPEVMGNMKVYKEKMMERSHLSPIVEKLEEMDKLSSELSDSLEMLEAEEDSEMREVIKEEIEELTLEIANTRSVTPQIKEDVINEFYEVCLAQQYIAEGGIAYAKELLEKALGGEKAMAVIGKLTSSLQVKPF